jgi:adapter protein MecA 1/2
MKIEKVNDSQIRCTLSKADLDNREIKLSELVYGSKKTKDLFRDMMEQASEELGFNANDIPLMIEAIPLETGSILLIITKVNEPEELDTRFSNFSSSIKKSEGKEFPITDGLPDNSDVSDLFKRIKELSESTNNSGEHNEDSLENVSTLSDTEELVVQATKKN